MSDVERTRALHDTLEQHLDLRAGELLAGWIVVYETAAADDRDAVVAFHYGPAGMTEWRVLGLLAWVDELLGPVDEPAGGEADDE